MRYSPSPLSFGIIKLQAKTIQIFRFKGVICKIFRNKDLGVSKGTDNVLVSLFIASTPVLFCFCIAWDHSAPAKAGAKTKGVAGGHALIASPSCPQLFVSGLNLTFCLFYFDTVRRPVSVMAITRLCDESGQVARIGAGAAIVPIFQAKLGG